MILLKHALIVVTNYIKKKNKEKINHIRNKITTMIVILLCLIPIGYGIYSVAKKYANPIDFSTDFTGLCGFTTFDMSQEEMRNIELNERNKCEIIRGGDGVNHISIYTTQYEEFSFVNNIPELEQENAINYTRQNAIRNNLVLLYNKSPDEDSLFPKWYGKLGGKNAALVVVGDRIDIYPTDKKYLED